jgi:hypothetical protein
MIGITSRRDIDMDKYSLSVVERATWDSIFEAQMMGHAA